LAVANYHDANGHYPPAYVVGPDGRPWHSWRVLVLPFIEQQELYDAYRFDEPWDGPHNCTLAERMPKIYRFHNRSEPGQTTTNYLAVIGPNTMWPGAEGRKPADVTDDLSDTVLIAENRGLGVCWMEPRDLHFDTLPTEMNHPLGVSSWYTTPAVVMADGMVHTFPLTLSATDLRAKLTATGGEGPSGNTRRLPDGRQRPDAK
jgi:Protein of unknown function (DUF1559)